MHTGVRTFFSCSLFLLSLIFFILSQAGITGAFLGAAVPASGGLGISIILLVAGLLVLPSRDNSEDEDLEKRLHVKHTVLQERKGGYYLFDTRNGESYSLDDLEEFSRDAALRKELRREYLPDFLKLYAEAPRQEKRRYKAFIEALSSPKTNTSHLERRLQQYQNVYNRIKDKIDSMNPGRVKNARPSDFNDKIYARFENERDTLWPDEGIVGFLPFDEVMVNPARGPLLSVVPVSRLIADGFLLGNYQLNPRWSKQKRQDYLRDGYGIDVGARARHLILFQVEKGARLEHYGNYENIVVEGRVPLVRVNKKK